jgi:hypothetical protein
VLLPLQRDINVERAVSFRQPPEKILAEILGGFPVDGRFPPKPPTPPDVKSQLLKRRIT